MKLIKNNSYLLLIDEEAEIKKGKTFITKDNIIHSNYGYNYEDRVIIAYYPLTKEAKELDLPLLPNFKKEEVDDVEKILNTFPYSNFTFREKAGFKVGYKEAQAKQFSLEDVKKAIDRAYCIGYSDKKINEHCHLGIKREEEIIQSLSTQQTYPKSFIPIIEYYIPWKTEWTEIYQTGKDKIIRLKTITNSEGKEEIQGTYIY